MPKYSLEIYDEAIMQIKEGKTDTEISKILGISTKTLRFWRREEKLPSSGYDDSKRILSKEVTEESIMQIKEGKTDTEISKVLGISTATLRKIRKERNLPPSTGTSYRVYTNSDWNEVIDLIRDGYIIGEISKRTGIASKRIREFWEDEKRNGNILPEIKKGQARKQKYSDDELIELAYLNQGYGFKRFVDLLGISEKFALGLFLEFKEFTGTDPFNGSSVTSESEDLLAILQDVSMHKKISWYEYKKITGKKIIPSKLVISGGGYGNRGASDPDRSRFLSMPPQVFNWGDIERR